MVTTIGTLLRSMREARALTLTDLAATIRVVPSHLSRIESGKALPSIVLLSRLTRALDLSDAEIAQLVRGVA